MLQILVTNNVEGAKPQKFTVSEKEYQSIESKYQYSGGFKRFEIDLYDDKAKGTSQMPAFLKWFFEPNR